MLEITKYFNTKYITFFMLKKIKCSAKNVDKSRCSHRAVLNNRCMVHFIRDDYKIIKKRKETKKDEYF